MGKIERNGVIYGTDNIKDIHYNSSVMLDEALSEHNAVGTSLVLDTEDGGIALNKLYGDSYKSKNLANIELPSDKEQTKSGITFANVKNGIKLSGTSTADYAQPTSNSWIDLELSAGKYKFKMFVEGTTSSILALVLNDGTSNYATFKSNDGELVINVKDNSKVFPYVLTNNATVDCYMYIMVVPENDEIDSFEAYGITSVGIENVLKPNLVTTTKNGVTCTKNGDGTFTLNGTSTASNFGFALSGFGVNDIPYPIKMVGITKKQNNVDLQFAMGSPAYLGGKYDQGDGVIIKQPLTNTTTVTLNIRIVNSGVEFNNFVIKPMLTTCLDANVNDFVPYGKGIAVKEHGKNLIKTTRKTSTYNGITVTNNEDGTFTLNGTATAQSLFELNNYNYKEFNGTYKLVGCPAGGSASKYSLGLVKNDGVTYVEDYGTGKVETLDGKYEPFIVVRNGVTVNNLVFKPMLTTDTTVTYDDFVKYEEDNIPIPLNDELRGINDVKDYIDDDGEHHLIGKVVFDGSDDENWQISSTNKTNKRVSTGSLSSLIKSYDASVLANIVCERYKTVLSNGQGTYGEVEGISSNGGAVLVYDSGYNTADISLWKAYLSSNPITVFYELTTPKVTTLSRKQKSAIHSLKAYKEKTYIDTVDTLAKAKIDVDYSKVLSKAIDGVNYGKLVPDLVNDMDNRNENTYCLISQLGFTSFAEINSWDLLIDAMPNYSVYEFTFSGTSRNQAYANGLIPENQIYKLKIYKHTSRSYLELESDESNWIAYDNNDGKTPSPRSITWRRLSNAKNVSDGWSNATSYEAGDYAIYNGSLWKCKKAHSNQAPAENTYWTEKNIASEMKSANTKLDNRVFNSLSGLVNTTIADEIAAGHTSINILKSLPTYCYVHLKATSGNRANLKSLKLIPIEDYGMLNIMINNAWASLEFLPFSTNNVGDIYKARVNLGEDTPTYDWYKFSGTIV